MKRLTFCTNADTFPQEMLQRGVRAALRGDKVRYLCRDEDQLSDLVSRLPASASQPGSPIRIELIGDD